MKYFILIGKRKVQKKGPGLCVMLPSVWLRNENVTKGDVVHVSIVDGKLVLEAKK